MATEAPVRPQAPHGAAHAHAVKRQRVEAPPAQPSSVPFLSALFTVDAGLGLKPSPGAAHANRVAAVVRAAARRTRAPAAAAARPAPCRAMRRLASRRRRAHTQPLAAHSPPPQPLAPGGGGGGGGGAFACVFATGRDVYFHSVRLGAAPHAEVGKGAARALGLGCGERARRQQLRGPPAARKTRARSRARAQRGCRSRRGWPRRRRRAWLRCATAARSRALCYSAGATVRACRAPSRWRRAAAALTRRSKWPRSPPPPPHAPPPPPPPPRRRVSPGGGGRLRPGRAGAPGAGGRARARQ